MWDDENYGAEFKFHGCRYLKNTMVFIWQTHQREGKYVDKSLSTPSSDDDNKMKGTILDGEIILNLFIIPAKRCKFPSQVQC